MIRSGIFWLSFLVTLMLALLLASRVEKPLPGYTKIRPLAGCQVELLDTRLQPAYTVVLSCSRVDSIRLWPLPVLWPFYEDPAYPEGFRAKIDTKLDNFTGISVVEASQAFLESCKEWIL